MNPLPLQARLKPSDRWDEVVMILDTAAEALVGEQFDRVDPDTVIDVLGPLYMRKGDLGPKDWDPRRRSKVGYEGVRWLVAHAGAGELDLYTDLITEAVQAAVMEAVPPTYADIEQIFLEARLDVSEKGPINMDLWAPVISGPRTRSLVTADLLTGLTLTMDVPPGGQEFGCYISFNAWQRPVTKDLLAAAWEEDLDIRTALDTEFQAIWDEVLERFWTLFRVTMELRTGVDLSVLARRVHFKKHAWRRVLENGSRVLAAREQMLEVLAARERGIS